MRERTPILPTIRRALRAAGPCAAALLGVACGGSDAGTDDAARADVASRADVAADSTRIDDASRADVAARTDSAPTGDAARAGVAVLRPAGGSGVSGVVRFEPGPDGLRVHASVTGLPEGRHAYHVHLYGDCSAPDATSAGTHFNFEGSSTDPPDDIDRITGNLGELVSSGNGAVTHVATIERASLQGRKAILGRAVVVHERGNDPQSPPIGNAGGRIACGVIGAADPAGPQG